MQMKNKSIIMAIIISIICLNFMMCNNKSNTGERMHEPITTYSDEIIKYDMDYGNDEIVYDKDYSKSLLNQIEKVKKDKKYTIDAPLIINNPFNTNTLGLYIYFKSDQPCRVEYNIHVDDEEISDFHKSLYNGNKEFSKVHEYQIIGVVPDKLNEITLTLYNKDNIQFGSKTFDYFGPNVSAYADIHLKKEVGSSSTQLSDGLFVTLGHVNSKENYSYYYDNDGTIRGEIRVDNYRIDRLLFKDNLMYISVDKNKIVSLNNLGYVEEVYDLGNYEMHHDYIFSDDKKSLLVLVSDTNSDSLEDRVISVNLKNKNIKEIIDAGNLFPDIKERAIVAEDKSKLDWIHINSLELQEDNKLLLSSRELSTIIKVDDIFSNPKLDYLIADKKLWQDTKYEKYLLEQKGDFKLQYGQHCLEIDKDETFEDSQYVLSLYDNNTGVSSSYTAYDWSNTYGIDTESNYYKYLINEDKKTFSLIEKIGVPASRYISSIQHYKNNLIVESGQDYSFSEFDEDNNLISRFYIEQEMWGLYRCFKYDFNDFYFSVDV